MSGTIARNTLFNALGRVWEAGLGLLLTAYIVRELGAAGWGLWSLVAVFMGYTSLLDLGVGSGFSKFVAQHAAHRDSAAVSRVVSTGLCYYLGLGVLIIAVGWPTVDGLMGLILWLRASGTTESPPVHLEELRFLFRGALILFAANNCVAPFLSVPVGLQRMGLSNALSAAASVVKAVATVLLLEMGFGVAGLLYANAIVLVFLALGSVWLARRILPGLRVGPRWVDRAAFASLFHFGWRTQVARFSNLINFQTDRVVVAVYSRFGDMAAVGVYNLAEYLASKMRQLPGLLVSALVPAASDLDARQEHERLRELYLRSTKYMAVVAVPMAVFSMAGAGPLLRALAGDQPGLGTAAWVLRILALGYLFNLLPAPGVSVVLGKGRADLQMYAGLISTTVNIALTVVLLFTVGFYGIPVATAIGMMVSTLWFFFAMRGAVGVSAFEVLSKSTAWPFVAAVPGAVACLAIQWWAGSGALLVWDLAGLAAGGLCLALSYVWLVFRLPYLDAFDLAFLRDTLRLGHVPGFAFVAGRARRA